MVRAAAKNFQDVVTITDKSDYFGLIEEMNKNKGCTKLQYRELAASRAFDYVAYYDSLIAEWLNKKLDIKYPKYKTFTGKKIHELR